MVLLRTSEAIGRSIEIEKNVFLKNIHDEARALTFLGRSDRPLIRYLALFDSV